MTVRRIAALGALVLTLTASQPAAAHVRVTPAGAAPGDRVEFELLVPGGHRPLDRAADGSIEVVRCRRDGPRAEAW